MNFVQWWRFTSHFWWNLPQSMSHRNQRFTLFSWFQKNTNVFQATSASRDMIFTWYDKQSGWINKVILNSGIYLWFFNVNEVKTWQIIKMLWKKPVNFKLRFQITRSTSSPYTIYTSMHTSLSCRAENHVIINSLFRPNV